MLPRCGTLYAQNAETLEMSISLPPPQYTSNPAQGGASAGWRRVQVEHSQPYLSDVGWGS